MHFALNKLSPSLINNFAVDVGEEMIGRPFHSFSHATFALAAPFSQQESSFLSSFPDVTNVDNSC